MKRDCKSYREEIADVVEGRASHATLDHVLGCPSCVKRVAHYRAILEAAKLPRESAPASLIQTVTGWMPDVRRGTIARRLSPLLAGPVRRQSAEFQVLVGDEETKIRLMVRPKDDGWIVMGRLPEGDWRIEGVAAEVEDDRFSFGAPSLEESAFTLESPDRRLEIPPISGLMEDDGEGG